MTNKKKKEKDLAKYTIKVRPEFAKHLLKLSIDRSMTVGELLEAICKFKEQR